MVQQSFLEHGIGKELILDGPAEHYHFLRAYGRFDVALDTFPYSRATTTTEALWQGVPVLSLDGERSASRTSRTLLLAAGLPEWVMDSQEKYVQRAIQLAKSEQTPNWLAALRKSMKRRLRASRVGDVAGFCREMERLYMGDEGYARSVDSSPRPVAAGFVPDHHTFPLRKLRQNFADCSKSRDEDHTSLCDITHPPLPPLISLSVLPACLPS